MRRPKVPDSLKVPDLQFPLSQSEWGAFVDEIAGGDDRTCAIIGGEVLNVALQDYLIWKLPNVGRGEYDIRPQELFGGIQPLSSFASRIEIGYACGILTRKEWWDLTTIRLIRNRAAHSTPEFSFKRPDSRELCLYLGLLRHEKYLKLWDEATRKLVEDEDLMASDPRAKFTFTVTLFLRLFNGRRGRGVAHPEESSDEESGQEINE